VLKVTISCHIGSRAVSTFKYSIAGLQEVLTARMTVKFACRESVTGNNSSQLG